jgi:hypothetical protein
MTTKYTTTAVVRWIVSLAALTTLVACATGPKTVNHGFGFNLSDSPEAELLAYRYGDSDLPVSWTPRPGEKNNTPQRTYVYGPMRQGDSLYVKWRLKATGEIHEETVDLRHRLPRDITEHRVYFMIKGAQLYVYLVPPDSKKLPNGASSTGPRIYRDLDVKTIYPDSPKS